MNDARADCRASEVDQLRPEVVELPRDRRPRRESLPAHLDVLDAEPHVIAATWVVSRRAADTAFACFCRSVTVAWNSAFVVVFGSSFCALATEAASASTDGRVRRGDGCRRRGAGAGARAPAAAAARDDRRGDGEQDAGGAERTKLHGIASAPSGPGIVSSG